MPIDVSITNKEKVHVKVNPKNDEGGAATLDGPAVFTLIVGDLTLEADADGLGVTIISGDAIGDFGVNAEGDADLTSGIRLLKDTINVHVTQAVKEATDLGLAADAPEPK